MTDVKYDPVRDDDHRKVVALSALVEYGSLPLWCSCLDHGNHAAHVWVNHTDNPFLCRGVRRIPTPEQIEEFLNEQ